MTEVLYFGSFNPVHFGHVAIVEYVAAMNEVDAVTIVPSPHSPFKDLSILADPIKRLEEVRKAFASLSPKIRISDIEYHMQEPLYTINTLHALKEKKSGTELVLLMGADNVQGLERWHRGNDIVQEFPVWVYPRAGADGAALCRAYNSRAGVRGFRFLEEAPLLDISSTQIRNQLNKNQIP